MLRIITTIFSVAPVFTIYFLVKVTKTKMEGGYRMVYLTYLWEAERKIAKSVSSLFTLQEGQPWKLEVDWNR